MNQTAKEYILKNLLITFSQVEPFYEQTGVRILTICIGPTDTPLMLGLRERAYDDKTGEELVALDAEYKKQYQNQK